MKKNLIFPFVLIAVSCSNNSANNVNENSDSTNSTTKTLVLSEVLDSAAIVKIGEHLRTLEPVDTSVLSSIFPAEVLSLKRTEIKGSEEPIPLNELNAEYKSSNKTITIHIIDGGSTSTDAYMTTQYYLNDIYLSKLNNGYEIEKIEKLNNIKAYLKQLNSDGDISSTIELVVANRYGIQIDGTNVKLDELKNVVNSLNLTKLK